MVDPSSPQTLTSATEQLNRWNAPSRREKKGWEQIFVTTESSEPWVCRGLAAAGGKRRFLTLSQVHRGPACAASRTAQQRVVPEALWTPVALGSPHLPPATVTDPAPSPSCSSPRRAGHARHLLCELEKATGSSAAGSPSVGNDLFQP